MSDKAPLSRQHQQSLVVLPSRTDPKGRLSGTLKRKIVDLSEIWPMAESRKPVARLRMELRRERARGMQGHWSYDLARHLSLTRQLKRAQSV